MMTCTSYELGRDGKLIRQDDTAGRGLSVGTILHWGGNPGWPERDYAILRVYEGRYWCFDMTEPEKNVRLYCIESTSIKRRDDPAVRHSQHHFLTGRTASAEVVAEMRAQHERQRTKFDKGQARAKAEADRLEAQGRELWTTCIPAGSSHIIVASRMVDDSDVQSDYFAEHPAETVILAGSAHGRDLFAEMRKAALRTPETQHLGPGRGRFIVRVIVADDVRTNGAYYGAGQYSHWHNNLDHDADGNPRVFTTKTEAENFVKCAPQPEGISFDGLMVGFAWTIEENSIEHRHKYSGGAGYFLQANSRGGWRVQKQGLSRDGQPSREQCIALARRHGHFT